MTPGSHEPAPGSHEPPRESHEASRYGVDVELSDVNTAHSLAVGAVTPGSDVLDIGAADGSVARALRKFCCRVWGVEIDKVAAEEAATVCEDVFVGDVEHVDLASVFEGRKFDVVLLLDVLEHLVHPEETLASVREVLAPEGYVVVSIPNVTHGAVRIQLLHGKFSYTETGLLDRTHLRFFDRPAVHGLVTAAGFSVIDEMTVRSRLGETEIPVDEASVGTEIAGILGADPDAETFQFILALAPDASPLVDDPPFMPLRALQRRIRELDVGIEALAAKLAREREEERRQLVLQLESAKAEAGALRGELASASTELVTERTARTAREAELHALLETRILRSTRRLREAYTALRAVAGRVRVRVRATSRPR